MSIMNIEKAIEEIRNGNIIILVDDEDRENEGDFVQAADLASPESVNFMITQGRGLLCQTITNQTADRLELGKQVDHNTSLHETAFTVSVDAIHGTTTGISAHDRMTTIACIADERSKPEDLGRPGHIFPIVAAKGGVLERPGHTEGSVELVRLAGRKPTGIICEILNEEGRAANMNEMRALAEKFNLTIVSIKTLILYLQEKEQKL